jgi:hypothetical protein
MCTTPVSTLLDFNQDFVLECDASRRGLRIVLMQEGRPLALVTKQLCDCNLGNPTYEKERMDILHVVETWCPYLIERCFQIEIDHHSLKCLLEQ